MEPQQFQENRNMEVANIIKDQLGGRALFMLGARYLAATSVKGNPGLTFRIHGSKKANAICIVLHPSDTYIVTFSKIRALQVKEIAKFTDVYCDQLHELIERITGLYTSL